jgi:hypothetical protein
MRFPQYQDGTFWSNFKLGFFAYASLLQERSTQSQLKVVLRKYYLSLVQQTGLLYRVAIGTLTMFFQQWTGESLIANAVRLIS